MRVQSSKVVVMALVDIVAISDGCGDDMKFPNVRGCTLKARAKSLVEEGQWVSMMHKDYTHSVAGHIRLGCEMSRKIQQS